MRTGLVAIGIMTAVLVLPGCGDWFDKASRRNTAHPLGVQPLLRVPAEGGVALEAAPIDVRKGQVVYVSAYSHVYHGDGARFLMAVTLSIRNTSPSDSIVIRSVRYYDSAGNLVKETTEVPLRLAPLATAEFLIPEQDPSGGSGANFLVEWVAERPDITLPVIETVMVTTHSQGISFLATGRVIGELRP